MDSHWPLKVMITSHSAAETIHPGRQLGEKLRSGDILALTGELGAGKTCLVKGIAVGLGVTQEVTSPTFTLINEYRGGRLSLAHLDLYRLETVSEAVNIGIEDYLGGPGVTVIEWAEKIVSLLPSRAIHIRLEWCGENARTIVVS